VKEGTASVSEARLFYLIGSSGAGKDTLIQYARRALAQHSRVVFAHRYITRPLQPGGENYIVLTEGEFALRARAGLFAMQWQSHGWRYGVGIEVDEWLARQCDVVVNGSRAHLAAARARYPQLKAVWITADAGTIARRLAQRGRESAAEIAGRLARNARFGTEPGPSALRIENEGSPEEAGARLVALLARESGLI
jgi:ribose 1,5-bisphosphokinase